MNGHPFSAEQQRTATLVADGNELMFWKFWDNTRLLTLSADNTIRVWDLAGSLIAIYSSIHGGFVRMATTTDRIALGDASGRVHLLELCNDDR